MTKPSIRYHNRITSLHSEGFTISELAIMYRTSEFQIEAVLEGVG